MKHSKELTVKEEEAIGVSMWDIATAMELNGRVPQEYFDSLNTAFKKVFNLPKQTLVNVTLQKTGEREWNVTAKSGEHWSEGKMKIPKITFIEY